MHESKTARGKSAWAVWFVWSVLCVPAWGAPEPRKSGAEPPRAAVEAPLERGVKRFQAGDLGGSREALQEAVRSSPRDATARAWLGFVLLKLNQTDAAI